MNPALDRSAPGVRLTVLPDEHATGGQPLDLQGRLMAFTFEDCERQTDKVTLQLDNFDLSLFEREELMGGAVLQVSWGYPGRMAPPRRVIVKKLKGFKTLTIEGQALSVLMNQVAKTRCWTNVSVSQVARIIAREHGFDGIATHIDDSGQRHDVINQAGETDARLLRRLATRAGFEFFVDGSGFHFHARQQHEAPTHVFTWRADPGRGDVMSINVESDLIHRVGRVTVVGRDPLERRTVSASATNETTNRTTLGEVIEVVDPETGETSFQRPNATATVRPTAARSPELVAQEAKTRFQEAERATIKFSMKVVGDPTLQAKSIVELRGVGSLLSGKYFVTRVRHTINQSGYTCDLQLTRDGATRRARPHAQPSQGQRNQTQPRPPGQLAELEVVDPETGQTRMEYRRGSEPLGAGDPEAVASN